MIWVHPEWLWALLLLPILVLLYIRYNKRHQAKLSLSAYRLLPKGSGWRSYLRALPFALELLALEDGTAIGLGLATAINTLRGSDNKSKVIILLTDGSNNAGDITPSMAAELAQQYGIRIYTVAAGTNGVAKFPVQTASGIEYVEADVQIDEGTLRHIAQQTGGKYYRATDETKLHEIYKEIDSLEKSRLTSRSVSAYEERYMLFALLAIVLLVAAFLLRNTLLRANP